MPPPTNATIKPKRGTTAPGPGSISQNELAVNTVSQSVYIGSVSGSGILVGSAPQGSNTQVQFNSSGVFAGSSNFTFDGSGVNVNGIVSSGLGISTSATTFNIVTDTASTINIGTTSGSTISIGNASGTTTIRNAGTNLNGTLTITGVSVHQGAGAFNSTLSVTGVTTLQGASTLQGAVNMNSTLTVTGATTLQSTLAVGGNTLSSSSATFNLLNTTVTNANVLGAATRVVIGANSSGDALIRNSNILLGGTVTGTTTISTTTGTAAHLTISPQGNLTLSPSGSFGAGGIRPSVTVPNNSAGTGTISISGAYVLIGNRNDGGDYSGEIRIQEQSGNDYFGLKAADTMAASTTYTLPSAFPASSGYILQSTTTGLMAWAAPSSSATVGVTATSASANYKLVFTDVNATNSSASFFIDTTSGIIFNPSTDALIVNGPLSTNSTLSVTGEATFAGSILANGGTITSSATTFNLLNTTVTNANVLGAANTILIGSISGTTTIRNAGTNINGTLTVTGASTLQGATSLNSNLTVTGAATLQSTLAVGGNTISSASTTFNLLNTTVTNANVLGAADTVVIGSAGGSTTIRNAATRFNGTLTVTGATVIQGALSTNGALSVTGTSTLIGDVTASGDIAVNGGDITSTATTFNLLNATVTNANVLGAATTLTIGAASGIATIRNPTLNIGTTAGLNYISTPQGTGSNLYIQPYGNLYLAPTTDAPYSGSFSQIAINNTSGGLGEVFLDGGNLHLGTKTTNDEDYTAVDLVFEGASQNGNQTTLTVVDPTADRTITLPDASGIVAITTNGSLSVTGEATFAGSIFANGGTITSTATTFNLLNATVTNANVLGAANTVVLGGTGGAATIRNAATRVNGTLTVTGATVLQGAASFNSTLTVTGATVVQGALSTNGALSVTGTSTLIGDVTASGDIAVNGGDITSTATTFNLLNATVTNANVLGAANTVVIGGAGGTSTIRNAGTNINGTLTVTGVSVYQGAGSFNSTLSVTGTSTFAGSVILNGTVSCNSNTINNPTLQYYNEVLASPSISANVLTLDLSTAQMFTVSLNANITTFTISNTPATANRSIGFTLIFTADGTARTVTWGAAVKWANNDPPALTSTNGKKDILSFVSPDGGTNWYGFIGGLNF